MKTDPYSHDERLRARILLLESRLIKEYGDRRDMTDRYIRDVVREACREFADARLHEFVPILVERAVRRKLARHSTVCAHAEAGAIPPVSALSP